MWNPEATLRSHLAAVASACPHFEAGSVNLQASPHFEASPGWIAEISGNGVLLQLFLESPETGWTYIACNEGEFLDFMHYDVMGPVVDELLCAALGRSFKVKMNILRSKPIGLQVRSRNLDFWVAALA